MRVINYPGARSKLKRAINRRDNDGMKEAVLIVSKELEITLFNNSAESLFSVLASETVGRKINTIDINIFNTIAENIKICNIYRNLDLSFESAGTKKFISVNIILTVTFIQHQTLLLAESGKTSDRSDKPYSRVMR